MWYGIAWHGSVILHDIVWYCFVWNGMAWHSNVWYVFFFYMLISTYNHFATTNKIWSTIQQYTMLPQGEWNYIATLWP